MYPSLSPIRSLTPCPPALQSLYTQFTPRNASLGVITCGCDALQITHTSTPTLIHSSFDFSGVTDVFSVASWLLLSRESTTLVVRCTDEFVQVSESGWLVCKC